MKIIIYEDDPEFCRYLRNIINNYLDENGYPFEVYLVTGYEDVLLEYLARNNESCIFFLDLVIIQGIEEKTSEAVAALIQDQGLDHRIILITEYYSRVIDNSYMKLNITNLIRKQSPNLKNEIVYSLNKALQLFQKKGILVITKNNTETTYLRYADIILIESTKKHYIALNHTNGVIHTYRYTLKSILEELDTNIFIRCHRFYIVNLQNICRIEGSEIFLIGNLQCRLSANYMKTFRIAYDNFTRNNN